MPNGWLPIDTYEKRVDELVTVGNKRDWESLRKAIIENGDIRNSVLCAHMPGEASTVGAGTTNGLYPARELNLMKTSETSVNYWSAPDSTKLKNKYELAFDIPTASMIKFYAVFQKWCDQSISADLYVKVIGETKVSSSSIVNDYLDRVRYGMKSRYYVNSLTSAGSDLNATESAFMPKIEEKEVEQQEERGCHSGSCTL